jgi:uncharacterized membrane protein YoaK (UPF0700 family)
MNAHREIGTGAISFTLSFIAGLVDVTSFVLLNGLFAAHVTGNLVVLGADLALHRPVRQSTALAVVVFIAVTAALAAAVDTSGREHYRWTQTFLWWQFACLAATAVVAPVLGPKASHHTSIEVLIALLAVAAMACQNALLHLTFKRAPSTAVMTGNIVASTIALVGLALNGRRRTVPNEPTPSWKADRALDRTDWLALWPLLLGFIVGCVSGAFASRVVSWWAWTGPALVSGILAVAVTKAGLPIRMRRDG